CATAARTVEAASWATESAATTRLAGATTRFRTIADNRRADTNRFLVSESRRSAAISEIAPVEPAGRCRLRLYILWFPESASIAEVSAAESTLRNRRRLSIRRLAESSTIPEVSTIESALLAGLELRLGLIPIELLAAALRNRSGTL